MSGWLLFSAAISIPTQARVLKWQDCVQLAIDKNPDLKANQAALKSTVAQEGVASSGFYPQLNASFGYNRFTPSTYDPTQDQGNSFDAFNATFKVNQNLFNGMQDVEKWHQAQSNSLASRASLQISKSAVSYSLKNAFEAYVYAKSYQKLTSDIIRRRQENLRIVELRFQGGRENKGSVLLSRANLNQAKFDDFQAKNLKEAAKTQLRQALGLDDNEDLDVADTVPLHTSAMPAPNFRAVVEQTPTYQQSVAQAQAAEHGTNIARGVFLPTFNLTGEYGTTGADVYPPIQHWIVGVNLNLNVLNGGKDYSSLQAASYTQMQNENQASSAHFQGVVTLRKSYNNLMEAIEKLKVDESFREAEITRAEIARRKYNNGLLSFEDWDIIESDLIFREKNYLSSLQARVIAEAAWERDQGTGAIP
jgi:outer membrane protein TolC